MNENFKRLENEILPIKKYVFKYWDKHGAGDYSTIINLFSLQKIHKLVLTHWQLDWYGGEEKISEYLKSLEREIMVGEEDPYEFKFLITKTRVYTYEQEHFPDIFFDVIVDGNGIGPSTLSNEEDYVNLYNLWIDLESGWEVDNQIRDITFLKIKKLFPGIFINVDNLNVVKRFPSNIR